MSFDKKLLVITWIKNKIFPILFGLLVSLILIEVLLQLGGFLYLATQEYKNRETLSNRDTYRILCLGESTTAMGGEHSYPKLLENILNANSNERQFSVINKGAPLEILYLFVIG